MAPRNSRGRGRLKPPLPQHTAKLLSKETIPIIDKAMYDQVYPSTSKSDCQLQYGVTETELNRLPRPIFSVISEYYLDDMPSFPQKYIEFKPRTKEEYYSQTLYDMDEEDDAWLGLMNKAWREANRRTVGFGTFEFLMDRFEKETRYERNTFLDGKLIKEIPDDDAVCYICTGGQSYTSNEILFCDMCNLAVHQECYGVPYVPEGQWLCRRCLHSPASLLYCVLCSKASGAFKQTDKGFWCHILCAIWTPEVQFSNSIFLDPICNIERIPTSRWNLICSICEYKDVGACVRCKYRTCRVAFHPTCAQQAGYAMMMKTNSIGYKKQRVEGIYCPKHSPKVASIPHLENTNYMNTLRPHVVKSLCSNVIIVPHVPHEKIKDIGDLVNFEKKNILIRRLLSYWALKRHLRRGVPLIQTESIRLVEVPDQNLPDEDSVTKVPEEEVVKNCTTKPNPTLKDDTALKKMKYQELWRIRQDLEKVRLLCELIRKREKLKSELHSMKYRCMELQFDPVKCYLRSFTENLISLDIDNLFSKAVDGSEAVNAEPTDFVQIKLKLETFQYDCLEQYESDFHSMISSRIMCYGKRTKIYKSATKLVEISKDQFTTAYRDIEQIEKEAADDLDKLPAPLSPQVMSESYENTSITEFAMEIDYYGYDQGPSTSYHRPESYIVSKRKNEEVGVSTRQTRWKRQQNAKTEGLDEAGNPLGVVKSKRKQRKKTRKATSGHNGLPDEEVQELPNCDTFADGSKIRPRIVVRRRTKNRTRVKYKRPPVPLTAPQDWESFTNTM